MTATGTATARLAEAFAHHREGRLAEAAELYRTLLNADPRNVIVLQLLGRLSLQSGDAGSARQFAERAIAENAADSALHSLLAAAQEALGDAKGVASSCRRALVLAPASVDSFLLLADAGIRESRVSDDSERNAVILATALRYYDRVFALQADRLDLRATAGLHIEYGNRRRAFFYYALWNLKFRPSDEAIEARGFQLVPPVIVRAIGHMVWLDGYLKMMHLGFRPRHQLVVLAPAAMISNTHYLDYWRDHVTVVVDPDYLNHLAPFFADTEYGSGSIFSEGRSQGLTDAVAHAQRVWEEQRRPPLLSVRDEDRRRGWEALRRLGMPGDAWFATVHMREAGFDKQQTTDSTLSRNFADQEHRNVNIAAFLRAIELIVSRGGWVVRLGDASMTPLPPMPHVIDYALSAEKSPWMDVFLIGSSRFYLGTSSGLWCVPTTFGVPAAITNVAPLATRPLSTKDLFMPKLAWREREQRFLSFEESMSEPVGFASHAGVLLHHGITPTNNSSEEIEELTLEMLDRLDGRFAYSAEDEARQARYLEISRTGSNWGTNSRIGRDFLRRHEDLLIPRLTQALG